MIHPTAIIDPAAELGMNVNIGAYSIIGANVTLGDDCELHPHVVIHPFVKLGASNIVHSGAVLGGDPQDVSFNRMTISQVVIGERNVIRENVTIHRGAKENGLTQIGDDCFLMAGAHLGHDTAIGSHVILANNVLLAGHVTVGDRVFLGGGSVVHQHTRIGRLVIAQGLSGFSKDIPPFTMAAEINTVAGLNAIGLKRAGFSPETRNEIKAAFALIYRSGLNVSQALAASDERPWGPEAAEFFEFIRAAKKRGICALIASADTPGSLD
ncbi:MAG: acyl-ACP--UDP-N-acetylglucosamine O-acyltransferase [Chthoniobacterales bacterium]